AENELWLGQFEKEELALNNLDFIERCGGTNDPEIIEKNQKRQQPKSHIKKKEPTVVTTKKLFDKGKTIDEVAHLRDLAEGTIISHLEKIISTEKDFDASRFRPSDKTIERIEKATAQLKKEGNEEFLDRDGRVKLAVLYRALNGTLDYESIRLARLFVES
ncbi:MAG: helix-turn-helix domain-containing protein, partial [Bacteroidota bacterium]